MTTEEKLDKLVAIAAGLCTQPGFFVRDEDGVIVDYARSEDKGEKWELDGWWRRWPTHLVSTAMDILDELERASKVD